MKPGVRVVRGPDWNHGNQDGGEGYLGTVVKLFPSNTVLVRWDIGTETECRAGKDGAFDLRIYDNAPIGVSHSGVTCNVEKDNIHGIRWKCLVCLDYDECTTCYMTKHHDPRHPYVRYNTRKTTVVRVPPAKRSRTVPVYGIFPGAEVKKVITSGKDEDKKVGIVKNIIDLQPDGYHGAVHVEWPGMRVKKGEDGQIEYPIYRMGAEGRVELQAVKPISIGNIYIDHLPVLDLTVPDYIELNVGDKVCVDLNLETYQALMKEKFPGGWDDRLELFLGEEGTIVDINNRNKATVEYESHTVTDMYINVLTKICTISAGDVVRIIDDGMKMRRLQTGHGGWQDSYIYILGAEGRVVRMEGQTDALVNVHGSTYVLNQACLQFLCKGQDPNEEDPYADQAAQLTVPPEAYRARPSPGVSVGKGVRVVRGPDWSSELLDQDGGEGHLGSIVSICGLGTDEQFPKRCLIVHWDSGDRNVYRAGFEKKHDLRIYDNAGLGIKHEVQCTECQEERISGMMWRCADCPEGEVTLCSPCYNADKHDINHHFLRIESLDDPGTRVPKRAMSKKLAASGMFEKCIVKRGPDWRWKDQDGGDEKQGEIIALVNFSPDTDRDAVEVTWENGYTNVYRLGYKGCLDVVAVKPTVGGAYYRDHIPVLRLGEGNVLEEVEPVTQSSEVPEGKGAPAGAEGPPVKSRFKDGDKVKIELDLDILKMIEEKRGAWNDRMADCIGFVGTVLLSNDEDVSVSFEEAGRWTFHESVLNIVSEYKPGQWVVVSSNQQMVRRLQDDRGGWNDLMEEVIGKKGVVEEVDEDGDVQVAFGKVSWTFNPECLAPSTRADDSEPPTKGPPQRQQSEADQFDNLFTAIVAGDLDRVNKIMETFAHLLVMEQDGKRAIHLVCNLGNMEIVKTFIKCSSKDILLEMQDGEGNTPLLAAVKGNKGDMIEFLVNEGANKEAQNNSKQSAVHIAVDMKDVDLLKLLCTMKFDINLKNRLEQTAVFDAVQSDIDEILDVVLNWPGVQLEYTDNIGFSPFLVACRKGSLRTIQKILTINPQALNSSKQDGFTGLHLAILNNRLNVVEILLEQPGIQIESLEKEGRTPLLVACFEGWLPIVEKLVIKGANIQAADNMGKTCLHLCFAETKNKASKRDEEVMMKMGCFLVEHGANTTVQDKTEKTPMHYVKPEMKEGFLQSVQQSLARRKQGGSPQVKAKSLHTTQNAFGGSAAVTSGPRSLPATMKQGQGQDDVIVDAGSETPRTDTQGQDQNLANLNNINSINSSQRIISLEQPPQGGSQVIGQGQNLGQGHPREEEAVVPDMCESCEEEPCRFQVQPCGHMMCGDCIPRRKQKKKVCACCGEAIVEVVDIQH